MVQGDAKVIADEKKAEADWQKEKKAHSPAGQDKTYVVTNRITAEVRTVTQREWREKKMGQEGWEKPADMPEDPA